MAESLTNAQVIGGVVVTIGSDLTGLKAGEREAKSIASNIERTVKVSLPVVFDTTRLVAQAPQLLASAQAAVRALPPVRIPVMLDLSGVAAQLSAVRGLLGGAASGGGGFGIPTVTSGPAFGGGGIPPLLPGAAAPAGGAGGPLMNTGRGWVFGAGSPSPAGVARVTGGGTTQVSPLVRVGAPNAAGGAGGGGAGASGGGTGTFTPDRFLGQIVKGTAVLRGAEFLAGSAVNTITLNQARARGDIAGEVAAQQQQEDLAVNTGNIFLGAGSAGRAIRDLFSWHGGRNDRAYIEEITAATALQEQRSTRMAVIAAAGRQNMLAAQGDTRRIGLANSLAFSTYGESGVANASFALAEFNRQQEEFRRANNVKTDSADVQANRAALQQAVGIASSQRDIERSVFGGRIQSATASAALGISGIRAYYAGDTEAAAKAQRDAERVALVQNQNERVLTAPTSEQAGLKRANRAELQLFDEQSAKDAFERQKQRAADLTQTIGEKQAAALQISKQYFAAELAAFDAKTKAELSLIDDKSARQNAADRSAAQRAVIVAREQQRVDSVVAISGAGTTAASLRIAHRGNEADLIEFDARARETLSNIANPRERAAREREFAAQRALIVSQQNEDRVNRQAGFATRTAQAQAFDRFGSYQPQVAGIIGTIAGFRSELRNAPAEDVQQIKSTQIAELEGLQKRIIGANAGQYAMAFDPRYDAARPIDNETPKVLKEIRDYLRQLLGGNTGPLPGVP